jgi:hypothetical protein
MASDIARLGDQSDMSCVLHPTLELVLKSPLEVLRIGRTLVVTHNCLLRPTGLTASTWLPVSSMLTACYCLDKHCVFKSLATFGYDRIISSASATILCIHVCAQQVKERL